MGERIGRVKVRKLMGSDKGRLIGKAKAVGASKAKQGIHSLLPISRWVFSHLQQSRVASRIMVTSEDKTPALQMSPLPFSSPSFTC